MFLNRRTATESKRIMSLGLPIVIGQVLQMSMGFVDTVMAGNLSPTDLAAVAIGSSFMTPVFVFSLGLLLAMNSIISQNAGAGKVKEIGRNFRQAVYLSQIMAWISFFAVRNLEWVMVLLEIDPEVVELAQGYIEAMSWGLPAITLYMVFRFFNEGISVTRPTMYFALVGLLFNILGNYTLMFGHFGFPALGAVGTGWASTIVAFAMLISIWIYTGTRKAYKRYELFHNFRKPDMEYMKELVFIGTPIGMSAFMEVSMFAAVALLMGKLGTDIVAAHQIAINIGGLIFMIPLGLSSAITVRVGFAKGKNDWDGVRRSGLTGIAISVGIMICTAILLVTIPEQLAGIYTDDPKVLGIAVSLLYMAAIFQISDGLQVAGAGALRGLKDTRIPMIVNFIAYWLIGLPTGYVIGLQLGYGPQGLWVGLIAGLTIAAILHNARFAWFLKQERVPS